MSVFRAIPYRLVVVSALLGAMALIGACAFAPVDRPVVDANQGSQQRAINLPAGPAFEVAVLAAKSMGYDLLVSNKAGGHVKTNIKAMPIQGNANCGAWHGVPIKGMASSALEIKVAEVGQNRSMVTVWALWGTRFQGRNVYGMVTRDESYRCASLGALESNYMEVLTRLAKNWSPREEKQAEKAVKDTEAAQPAAPAKTTVKPQPQATAAAQDASTAAPPAEEVDNPKLQKLKMLKTMGLLSDQEFEQEKAKLGLSGN